MQNIRTYITLFLLLLSVSGTAQKDFVIYHVTGTVDVITGSKTVPALRGNVVIKGDKIKVSASSSCMLIEQSGKSIEIAKPGIYTFDALVKQLPRAGKDAVTMKFLSYLYNNMFSGHGKEKQGVTPVVFRDQGLMVSPIDNTIVYSSPVLSWKMPLRNLYVRVLIKDMLNEVILDTIVKKTTSLKTLGLKTGVAYQWKAEEAGNKQSPERYYHFLIADEKDRVAIEQDVKLLKGKTLTAKLQAQLREDILIKWSEHYIR